MNMIWSMRLRFWKLSIDDSAEKAWAVCPLQDAALINDDCDECWKQGGYELRFC